MKRKKTGVKPAEAAALPIASRKSRAIVPRKTTKRGKCIICGGAVAPFSTEALCWVCRRLKISAWRESENQPSIQE
ncbi:MAG: hypothetical protein P4K98_01150 [Bryobacteraceae bacterium]|nr:hypothetical protein [Bryobacteraceae bacterium]